jgi:energy-coupling factor transporter ATP-binding protein EcfA2
MPGRRDPRGPSTAGLRGCPSRRHDRPLIRHWRRSTCTRGLARRRSRLSRAIALHPDPSILDEPTAALDVWVQAVVLNLLQDLKDTLGMSYLFVSYDLNVVRLLCDRVIVMRQGKIVERGRPSASCLRRRRSTHAICWRRSHIRRCNVIAAPQSRSSYPVEAGYLVHTGLTCVYWAARFRGR